MAAFQPVLVLDDILFAYEVEVLVEFAHLDVADTASHIHLSIVEQHAGIVVDAREALLLPFPFRIACRQQPAAGIVAVDEQIELSVVIFHRTSPHAARIGIGAWCEVVVVGRRELRQRLCTVFPVHEVLRLQNRRAGEVVHRGRYHVVGVAHTDDIRIGEVGTHHCIGIAGALIGSNFILEVGMRPVHLVIVGIPVHARLAAGLLQSVEGWNHLSFVDECIDVDQATRSRERHRNVAIVVEHRLERLAPLRRGACCPRAVVRFHPITMLVVMAFAGFLRTPVHLGDNHGVGVHHGHLLMELVDLVRRTRRGVAAAIPAAIVMYGIAYVITLNGICSIVGIVSLPTRARHPNDSREAIGANLIHHRLEEVVQRLRVVLSVGILQRNGFVGELDADLAGILLDGVVLREEVPHCQQVVLIVVAHLQIARTYARRAHHHIHAVLHGIAGNREIERLQIRGEAVGIELPDVGLALRVLGWLLPRPRPSVAAVRVVGPCGFEMQAEHIALRHLESLEQFLEVFDTASAASVVVRPSPASVVKPGTWRVHYAMQHHVISVCVG